MKTFFDCLYSAYNQLEAYLDSSPEEMYGERVFESDEELFEYLESDR